MKLSIKQYNGIKIGVVVLIAIIASQSVIYKNFILPVVSMAVCSLILLYCRKHTQGILADERDYATGGKAALLAMQIYSWIAVIGMFALYSLRDINPTYEAIAMTLAFSVCIYMCIYTFVFKYYNSVKWSNKTIAFSIIVFIVACALAAISIRTLSGEDNWICEKGQWIQHGHPEFPAPSTQCK